MHETECRFVIRPLDILFAGVYLCTFQPENVAGWDSQGVKLHLFLFLCVSACCFVFLFRAMLKPSDTRSVSVSSIKSGLKAHLFKSNRSLLLCVLAKAAEVCSCEVVFTIRIVIVWVLHCRFKLPVHTFDTLHTAG